MNTKIIFYSVMMFLFLTMNGYSQTEFDQLEDTNSLMHISKYNDESLPMYNTLILLSRSAKNDEVYNTLTQRLKPIMADVSSDGNCMRILCNLHQGERERSIATILDNDYAL